MATASHSNWQFFVDRGGTFTDILAVDPNGKTHVKKLLSDNPIHYQDAAVHGIRELLGLAANAPVQAESIESVRIGTTIATNALLERKGEPTVLITNKGFADCLRIGYQNRPDIFARKIVLPDQLYVEVIEVSARFDAQGNELESLDEGEVDRALSAVFDRGIKSLAVVLMHAYRFAKHEKRISDIAKAIGFTQISCSSDVIPLIKMVSRGDTTVADAYLSPILKRYVERISSQLPGEKLLFMQSNGGLVKASHFKGKDSLLSGPAGGIVGAVAASRQAGFEKIIAFDMGGTSTDVSHFDGEYERTLETNVAGVRIRAPMMAINTVAAGGGSIIHFDGARYQVGPESAGAKPGPACYRLGGPLTITDVNVMLGKLPPQYFPHVFGQTNDQPIDARLVSLQFEELARVIEKKSGNRRTKEEVAEGFLEIAVEKMVNAIKKVSIERGYDVEDYALCCFGGAGGQHACLIAERLGISTVLSPPFAGVLSAYGIACADLRALRQSSQELPLHQAERDLENAAQYLINETRRELLQQGVQAESISVTTKCLLRYQGSDTSLAVQHNAADAMANEFHALHLKRFGFSSPEKALTVEALNVEAVGKTVKDIAKFSELDGKAENRTRAETEIFSRGRFQKAQIHRRDDLAVDELVASPAIIIEETTTTIVEPGWTARKLRSGHLELKRLESKDTEMPSKEKLAAKDPVRLELFNNFFMSCAEEMGLVLQNTSHSVNIKERLDFSCALFDEKGDLIANAPHIPVHLGSMGESVKTLIRQNGESMIEGDAYVLNNPYNGGTHLPDITVINPVYVKGVAKPAFFVASRGHHADIGGITPGSMPPNSKTIEEEGVVIDNFLLARKGQFFEEEMAALLKSHKYPARNVEQNIADLKAQLAANSRGQEGLLKLVDDFGYETVKAYMGFVMDNAATAVEQAISKLSDGEFDYAMDDGTKIRVAVSIDASGKRATIDFTGSSSQVDSNLNAPLAISRAAVLYVFRTLVDQNIPLNDGCIRPLTIIVPPGSILNPQYPAAVVAGNVETSQAVVDALYGAIGAMAASQGTMNNFTFGDKTYQYYETICGGAGAGPDFDGTSAVHTHMTNSRLTDPEILELRFPVLVKSFSIRKGSGGSGKFHGGDGVVRKIEFLHTMQASILSQRRIAAPFGLAGAGSGALGKNYVERGKQTIALDGTASFTVQPGDVFVIETPGGGGYGTIT